MLGAVSILLTVQEPSRKNPAAKDTEFDNTKAVQARLDGRCVVRNRTGDTATVSHTMSMPS